MFTDVEIMLMNARDRDHREYQRDFRDQEASHARQMRIQKAKASLEATSLNRQILVQKMEAEMRAFMDGVIDDIRKKGTEVPDDYFLALKGFVEADLMEMGITPMHAVPGALAAFRKYEQQILGKRAASAAPANPLSPDEKEAENYARMLGKSIDPTQRSKVARLLAAGNRTKDDREQKRIADEIMSIIDPAWEEDRARHDKHMNDTLTSRRDRHARGEKLTTAADSFFLAALAVYSGKERIAYLRKFVEPLMSWKEKLVLKATGRLPAWSGAYD